MRNPEAEDYMERQPLLHEVLRDCRVYRNLTQAQAAEALGVHRNTVARWERGELGFHPAMRKLVEAWIDETP